MAGIARLLLVARAGPLADGLKGFLSTISEVQVIGHVDELSSSMVAISDMGPTVVVLAFGPSPEQNLAAVTWLEAALPESRYIVLANDVQQQRAAEDLGADAVLLEGCSPSELLAAIRALTTENGA